MAAQKTKVRKSMATNNNLIYLVLGAIVLLMVFVVVKGSKKVGQDNYMPLPEVPQNTYPAIQNTSDLDKASKELDATNPNSMDQDLNGLGNDASSL